MEENTFLNANNLYEDVEGESGKTLSLEEDQQRNLIGIIKSRYAQAENSRDIAEKRWEICKKCPHLLYDQVNPDTNKKDGRCIHCGCFMNVKVHYAVAECPIDKWDASCQCNPNKECD